MEFPIYYKLQCGKCGRKILVEVLLIGSNHNADVMVNCAECLKKSGVHPEFKKRYSKAASDIERWISEG